MRRQYINKGLHDSFFSGNRCFGCHIGWRLFVGVILLLNVVACSKNRMPKIEELIQGSSQVIVVSASSDGYLIDQVIKNKNGDQRVLLGAKVSLNLEAIHRRSDLAGKIVVFCRKGSVLDATSSSDQTEIPLKQDGTLSFYKLSLSELVNAVQETTGTPTER